MGHIEEVFDELDTDVSLEAFRERVAAKVEEMGGLADEETAAMLVAHELEGHRPVDIAAIQPEMEVVTVLGVVQHIGEVRTFERDDGDTGAVVNIEVADGTGSIRAAFWDERATAATEELDRGDTLRLKARPRDGLDGIELSVTDVRLEDDLEVEVAEPDVDPIGQLVPDMGAVMIQGEVLRIEPVRTFDRDDGDEGRVATVVLGDHTGAVAVSLWDDATTAIDSLTVGDTARVVNGSVRERDGRVEVHVGGRSRLEQTDEAIRYQPIGVPIDTLAEGDVATITGIVRSTDPIRTFDRADGSEGNVRNVRVQDETGDIRVALWGERAEIELAPGDDITLLDVTIQEGYRDDLEASANWRSTVLDRRGTVDDAPSTTSAMSDASNLETGQTPANGTDTDADHAATGPITFTGTVIQPGDPIILDDGTETVHVDWDGDVTLGQRVTVTGHREDDYIDATALEPVDQPR